MNRLRKIFACEEIIQRQFFTHKVVQPANQKTKPKMVPSFLALFQFHLLEQSCLCLVVASPATPSLQAKLSASWQGVGQLEICHTQSIYSGLLANLIRLLLYFA